MNWVGGAAGICTACSEGRADAQEPSSSRTLLYQGQPAVPKSTAASIVRKNGRQFEIRDLTRTGREGAWLNFMPASLCAWLNPEVAQLDLDPLAGVGAEVLVFERSPVGRSRFFTVVSRKGDVAGRRHAHELLATAKPAEEDWREFVAE